MIMRALTYSWIGLSAAAPLIFLMCAWVLGVFHSYRRHWRSVDLFLLSMFVQELLMALQVFAYALLSLMRPESSAACGIFVWSLSSTRTLQAATVASLLIDRALTSQWPYKYRFSVRRHQIRYHLAVLATIAALVGVAAILARPSSSPESFDNCGFLPHNLHVRLSLFILSVYGILVVASGISVGVVLAGRGCKESLNIHSDIAPITTTASSTSSSSAARPGTSLHAAVSSVSTTSSNSSSSHGGVHSSLQPASSTSDLLPPPPPPLRPPPVRGQKDMAAKKTSNVPRTQNLDFRWGTAVAVATLCFIVNHFPYMGVVVVGTFFPSYLGTWSEENIALWLSLAEGLLLPIVLGLVDATFSEAAGASCSRDKAQIQKYKAENEGGPFRFFPKDEVKSFPLTNGSLFSSLLNMNVDNPSHMLPSYRPGGGGLKMGVSSQEIRGLVGSPLDNQQIRDPYGSSYFQREPTESIGSIGTSCQDPIYSDPLTKVGSIDSSLKEDHIYATLSETFGSLSSLSDGYLGDDQRCSSVTTVANDDFEFHDPRGSTTPEPGVCYTRDNQVNRVASVEHTVALSNRPPAQLPPDAYNDTPSDAYQFSTKSDSLETDTVASSFRSSSSQVTATIESTKEQENMENTDSLSCLTKEPGYTNSLNCLAKEAGYTNSGFENDTLEKDKEFFRTRSAIDTLHLRQKKDSITQEKPGGGTLSRKHRSSSLSMNDLDRLDVNPDKEEEEMMFILPVKSESMLSLYRLYLAEDEAGTSLHYSVEISRSEGDLSVLANSPDNSVSEGKSENSLHEVYQKRRAPEVSGSRVKRQHKIQRAKGIQQRLKTRSGQLPDSSSLTNSSVPPTNFPLSTNTSGVSQGLQVSILDKTHRRNGIITIQDPSVLTVEELFHVLDRASAPSTAFTDVGDRTYSTPAPATPVKPAESEFKKIFVSEYL